MSPGLSTMKNHIMGSIATATAAISSAAGRHPCASTIAPSSGAKATWPVLLDAANTPMTRPV
jgi:hypothetical protein